IYCRTAFVVSRLAWSNSIFTGPTPYTHQTNLTPLPNGSPSAPACVISERTFAATTGCGNAGTVIFSVPTYDDELDTSPDAPPVESHSIPSTSGSCSVGLRLPQIKRWYVAAIVLLQLRACAQRIGNSGGGALLDQPVLKRPMFVCWNDISPLVVAAS